MLFHSTVCVHEIHPYIHVKTQMSCFYSEFWTCSQSVMLLCYITFCGIRKDLWIWIHTNEFKTQPTSHWAASSRAEYTPQEQLWAHVQAHSPTHKYNLQTLTVNVSTQVKAENKISINNIKNKSISPQGQFNPRSITTSTNIVMSMLEDDTVAWLHANKGKLGVCVDGPTWERGAG